MSPQLILTCEHGGRVVPKAYAHLFRSHKARRALAGHRGMDYGALALAEYLSEALHAPLVAARVTRLLVDLNRSPGHPQLFSEFSRDLDAPTRERLLDCHYSPHRQRVTEVVRDAMQKGRTVWHVAVHSFTPRLHHQERNADIGLLYDSTRVGERRVCALWRRALDVAEPRLRVRRNYPYLGRADGLTTHLRRELDATAYLGIELEVNQRRLRLAPRATAQLLAASLGVLRAG